MDIYRPVANIMTTELYTVNPADTLQTIKELFDKHRIHHIPVVRFRKMIGLISKSDFLHFMRKNISVEKSFSDESRLRAFNASDIMKTKLATIAPDERIDKVLAIFLENLFHCLPVVEGEELVGIVTTHDVIKQLLMEETTPRT